MSLNKSLSYLQIEQIRAYILETVRENKRDTKLRSALIAVDDTLNSLQQEVLANPGLDEAVEWIAYNDSESDLKISSIMDYISTALVADLYGKRTREVAKLVAAIRKKK